MKSDPEIIRINTYFMLEGILKHAEQPKEILSASGPDEEDVATMQAWKSEYTSCLTRRGHERDTDYLKEAISREEKRIELSEKVQISCSVELPNGFVTLKGKDGLPIYDSGPLRTKFTINEGGSVRSLETTARIRYSNVPGAMITIVGGPNRPQELAYILSESVDEVPWDAADEDGKAKNTLAYDVFQKAMKSRNTAPDFFRARN